MSSQPEQFNPTDKFITIQGGALYLQVKDRLIWARKEHPDLSVSTDMLRLDETIAVFKALVSYTELSELRGEVAVAATGHGSESPKHFQDYIEKAETKAIGRALAALGYGTAAAFEEDPERIADAPVRGPQAAQPGLVEQVRGNAGPSRAEQAHRAVLPEQRVQAGPGQATQAQLRRLRAIGTNKWRDQSEERLHGQAYARYRKQHLGDLTKQEASDLGTLIENDDLLDEVTAPQERVDPQEAATLEPRGLPWEQEPEHLRQSFHHR